MKRKLHSWNTVFTAEAQAILQALKYIKQKTTPDNYLILTDSLSTLHAIKNTSTKKFIVEEIQALYTLNLTKKNDIKFIWVPSHVNIEGNEQADEAAKQACASDECMYLPEVDVEDAKSYMKKFIKLKWHEEWRNTERNKLREIKSDVSPWIPDEKLNRREQVVLSRIRIGHTNYTHQHLMKKEEVPICQVCNVPITVKHFMFECNKFLTARRLHQIGPDTVNRGPKNVINYTKHIGLYNFI
ncbi:hypothetical protein WDU94_012202 [Cyamophila willieti]